MSKHPKITVLLAVYNGERFLRQALDSISDQTFKDYECVIINDGSVDSTAEILLDYRDPRFIVVQNGENLGLTSSLNRGLALARGQYIARMDADDISLPDRLELQVRYLDVHPEVGAIGGAMEIIDGSGESLGHMGVRVGHEIIKADLLINDCSFYSPTATVRTSLLQQLNGYNESYVYAQDYDLWWRLSEISHLESLRKVLVKHRRHGTSISQKHRQAQMRLAYIISQNAVQSSLNHQYLDTNAYQRFWWTYHSRRESLNITGRELQSKDIRKLWALWELLASNAARRHVWGPRLAEFGYYLIQHKYRRAGIQLLGVVRQQFRQPVAMRRATRNFILSLQ
ncbi:MAG: glycosyltransferase [Candidatus Peribacteraceae bacterium]|jgi:glycosyltransferase involved in cell wall biosynthesis